MKIMISELPERAMVDILSKSNKKNELVKLSIAVDVFDMDSNEYCVTVDGKIEYKANGYEGLLDVLATYNEIT